MKSLYACLLREPLCGANKNYVWKVIWNKFFFWYWLCWYFSIGIAGLLWVHLQLQLVRLLSHLVLLQVLLLLQLSHTFAGTSTATAGTVDSGGTLAKNTSTSLHPVTNFWHASQLIIGWGRRWRWNIKMMIAMHPAIAKFVTRITSYNWTSKFSSHHYGPHLNLTTFLQHPPIYVTYNLISHSMAVCKYLKIWP